jgi:hypothetical protein
MSVKGRTEIVLDFNIGRTKMRLVESGRAGGRAGGIAGE